MALLPLSPRVTMVLDFGGIVFREDVFCASARRWTLPARATAAAAIEAYGGDSDDDVATAAAVVPAGEVPSAMWAPAPVLPPLLLPQAQPRALQPWPTPMKASSGSTFELPSATLGPIVVLRADASVRQAGHQRLRSRRCGVHVQFRFLVSNGVPGDPRRGAHALSGQAVSERFLPPPGQTQREHVRERLGREAERARLRSLSADAASVVFEERLVTESPTRLRVMCAIGSTILAPVLEGMMGTDSTRASSAVAGAGRQLEQKPSKELPTNNKDRRVRRLNKLQKSKLKVATMQSAQQLAFDGLPENKRGLKLGHSIVKISVLREAFYGLDLCGDGELALDACKPVIARFVQTHLSASQLVDLFDGVDDDGSGKVNFIEFMHLIKSFTSAVLPKCWKLPLCAISCKRRPSRTKKTENL